MGQRSSTEDTLAAETDGSAPASTPVVLERGAAIGRYMVLSRIGAGGMGVVYAAYDPELDRKVALKLLHTDAPSAGQTDARRRLQREAQALAKLDHPNVVAVHDVLEHDGRIVLAMEFVEGATLTAWRAAAARSWREVLDVFVAAGRGLIAAHDRGLVHRDFKPDNVMITPSAVPGENRVRVMDFGLARPTIDTEQCAERPDGAAVDPSGSAKLLETRMTRAGRILGTPAYMAPEQLAGLDVGSAADQFAFCVALWEALYGERPFRGDGLPDLVRAITEGERSPPPPGADVPRWLHRVCERGMAADATRRFADMRALVATLQNGHRRTQIRVAAIGLGAIAVTGLGVVVARHHAQAQAIAACERDGAAIGEVWNDETRAAVHGGLLRSGAMAAETTAEKVTPWLEEHARAWELARTDACLAHSLHGRWDTEMLDLAASCLDERRLELQALVTRLADADSEAANRAVEAATGLSRIEPCLDDATLRGRSPRPAETRDEILEVHAELARAEALRATGAYAEGLEGVQATVAKAEALGWPRLIVLARRRHGRLLERTGAYADAEKVLEAAYFEALRAGEIDEAFGAADDLANLVGATGARFDDGMRWAKHADVLRAAIPDPLGLREMWGIASVARIDLARGRYAEAQDGLEAVLVRMQAALGPEHPRIGACLDSLGLAHFRRGDYAQARAHFERALAIVETTKGREHRDVWSSLNNVAIVEIKTGAYAEARGHLERARDLQIAALGPSHPTVAVVLSNLGVAVQLLGEYEEATALHERALKIREAALGPEHPDVADSLSNLGRIHYVMGHADDAKPLQERALAIKQKALGPDHPEVAPTLFELGSVLQRQGDDDAAEALFVEALAILEPALGPEHPDLADPLVGLARVAIDRGRGPQAVAFAERALALREQGDEPAEVLATAQLVTARALMVIDAHTPRAAQLATQACATFQRGGPAMRSFLAECEAFTHDGGADRTD